MFTHIYYNMFTQKSRGILIFFKFFSKEKNT
nr:MAG TPA: hypothetical protein [Caudoviricetes sp.]